MDYIEEIEFRFVSGLSKVEILRNIIDSMCSACNEMIKYKDE